jgi:hypothetical protein
MTRDKAMADTEEAEITMTDAVVDTVEDATTIEDTEASATTAMMTVAMLPVELIQPRRSIWTWRR